MTGILSAATNEPPTAVSEFDEFVYLLSHDVRASVRAMSELPEWIKEDLIAAGVDLPGPVTEYFGLLNTHTVRLDQMLLDLLAYSRVGRMQKIVTIDVEAAVASAVAAVPGINTFKLHLDLDAQTLRFGDKDFVTLVTCLLSNAVKHNPSQTGTIHLEFSMQDREIRLRVEDDGPGIAQKDRDRAVRPMTTLKSRDEVDGSGMGLAIATKIATQNSGTLEIADSQLGNGIQVIVRCLQPLQS